MATAFMVAHNRLAELSTWDEEQLGEIFQEISFDDSEFDLETTGFDHAEIDLFLKGITENTDETEPGDAEDVSGPPTAKPGDCFILGQNRVFCGDARNGASVPALMAGKLANVIVADFPYNCKIQGHVSGKGQIKHREFAMASGEMKATEFEIFIRAVMAMLIAFST